jgi:beta-glucosidase-like glycosyl hydrolase
MRKLHWNTAAALGLAAILGCGGGGSGGGTPVAQCAVHTDCGAGLFCSSSACVSLPSGECRKDADCSTGQSCASNACQAGTVAECDKPANVARKAALVAAQPALGVRTKAVLGAATTFASVAGDATVQCPVTLSFKDANGNGTLDAYEDWTKTSEARATDLAGKMTAAEKAALMAHATLTDSPTTTAAPVSAATSSVVGAGIRFGRTAASTASLTPRATWANNVQAACEATKYGIPFVLSMDPAHSSTGGRAKAKGFTQFPSELSLAAGGDLARVENFGKIAAQEYRAIGVRMALSPSADLATDPRWWNGQFTFGEDSARVAAFVGAYVKGVQGAALGPTSVACVVNHFPGAGAAESGFDARLAKGKFTSYPGNNMGAHLAAFETAFANGVAGVMPGYGIPKTGSWTALGGLLDGASIEQVGASFNAKVVGDALRSHYAFSGLVLAPWGVLDDASANGAPWGVETLTKPQRLAKAVAAGVDQFGGLSDTTILDAARTGGLITDAQIDASAKRALALAFQLGLFENPYVDAAVAPTQCNADASYQAGLSALDQGMVLVVNKAKPAGWLNGAGDGTQSGDKGNAGNGSGKVLPAPPGQPYVSAGCTYFVAGDFNLDYVRSVSTGYGTLTNDVSSIGAVQVTTDAEKMANSDYVFVRVAAPYVLDADATAVGLALPTASLSYGASSTALAPVKAARDAITAWNAAHPAAPSKAQIVVAVDASRPSVLGEIEAYDPSGLYVAWGVTDPSQPDKVFLDVAFGIVAGNGKLPVALPASDATAGAQSCDVAGDGADATFVKGFGLQTSAF